ncbi:MAG: nucleotidyltransferase domain-containing protein [Halobacteriota archaeon]
MTEKDKWMNMALQDIETAEYNLIGNLIEKLSKKIRIEKVIIFGSRARGEEKEESDVDLLIISPDFKAKKFRERALGFYKYYELDFPVDFICFTPEEFEKMKDRATIVKAALEEGTLITNEGGETF